MNAERVSVVIPCYNAARYIGASLRSVLAQDWPQLEIIVVDDGSKDGSADLVVSEFPGVTVLRQANQGAAAARNLGIRQAHGDWVAFLDADDLWLPGKLQAQLQLGATQPDVRLICAAWQEWTSTALEPGAEELATLLVGEGDPDRWRGPSGWIYPQLLTDCSVWTSTVMARRSLFDEIGLFDPALRLGQDYDLWLRASRVTRILHLPRPYALYRMHPGNSTKGAPSANFHGVLIERAIERWGFEGPDGARADEARVRRTLAHSWCDFGSAQLEAGNLKRARDAGRRATRIDWRHVAGWKILLRSWLRSRLRHDST